MRITISNTIRIDEPAPEILEYCKQELVIGNPEYDKKLRMGLYVGRTPRKLKLYTMDGKSVICPVGAFSDIKGIIARLDLKVPYMVDLASHDRIEYGAQIALYDYQEAAVTAMYEHGFGILQAPAGSGKTQMGIALIDKLGVKTLWLTHTRDLLKQSYDRAVQCGVDKSRLGTITAGEVNLGDITFATVQTLSRQDLTQFKYTFDCIIVDECHRCAGTPTAATQFSKVLNNLAARYKYGLSATVHRADGLIKTTFALLGKIAYTVSESAVKDKIMRVQIKPIATHINHIPYGALDTDGTIIYTKLITELALDMRRNKQIVRHLLSERERYHLILSDRLDQLYALYNMLPNDLRELAAVIDGSKQSKKAKAEREQVIEDMRQGKKHFLFASYKLAKEGLDIPRLDRLHLATPQKDYAVIVQSVGRVGRAFPGKGQPICFDYVDDIGIATRMYSKRCTSYRKCNCIL